MVASTPYVSDGHQDHDSEEDAAPHRRIDANGHPTLTDFEEAIRANRPSSVGLLAFEFLRRFWERGFATEASWAVRVLAKDGFTEADREESLHGTNVVTTRRL